MSTTTNKTTYSKSWRLSTSAAITPFSFLPYPNIGLSGTTTAFTATTITDTTKNFLTAGVKVNDILYNPANGINSLVDTVTATQITFKAAQSNMFSVNGAYQILTATDSGPAFTYDGFVVYNTQSANRTLIVVTLDGVNLTVTIPAGGICPIQCSSINANSNAWGDLVALW